MKQLSSILSLLFFFFFFFFKVILSYTIATGKDLGFPVHNFAK